MTARLITSAIKIFMTKSVPMNFNGPRYQRQLVTANSSDRAEMPPNLRQDNDLHIHLLIQLHDSILALQLSVTHAAYQAFLFLPVATWRWSTTVSHLIHFPGRQMENSDGPSWPWPFKAHSEMRSPMSQVMSITSRCGEGLFFSGHVQVSVRSSSNYAVSRP